jgi:hypothetical protein
MTKSDLQNLRNIIKEITPGPWKSFIEGRDHTSGSNFIQTGNGCDDIEFVQVRQVDQDFIALARNILPELLEELDKLLPPE